MKRKFIKTILFLTVFCLTFGLVSGCAPTHKEYSGALLPDYSGTQKRFEFFAYRGMGNGSHTLDGVLIMPEERYAENFNTEKACKLYKDAGFTMMAIGGINGYTTADTGWEGSNCQKAVQMCVKAGLERNLISDNRISQYISYDEEQMTTLFGTDGVFDDEKFNAKIKECMSIYINEPGVYGLTLGDEPNYNRTYSYGKTYRAIKKAAQDLGKDYFYIHMNFLPIDNGGINSGRFPKTDENGNALNFEQSYRKYIEDYLIATGADRISVDIYFFRANGYYPGTFANLQILREVCDKYNASLSFCLQSFEMWNGESENYSKVDKNMMLAEIETCIGMGIDDFAYYTYNVDPESSSTGTKSMEGSAFLNFKGEPNSIYYFGQEVMAEMKGLEKVILNYKFKGSNMFTSEVAKFNNSPYITSNTETSTNTSIIYKRDYQFALIKDFAKDFTCDNDVAFVTELYDQKNDLYMYMVQNVIDVRNGKYGDTTEHITVNFGTEYKYIAEFDGGRLTYRNLDNGVYSRTLTAGQGVYIVPLK